MSLRRFVFSASIALSFASLPSLTGCAADTTTVPAGSSETADPTAPTDGTCSTLRNVAKPVEILEQAGEPPPATGGTIVDGTYVAIRAVRFTGSNAASGSTGKNLQMTIRITGSIVESIFDDVPRRARVQIEGTTLRTTVICPSTASDDVAFVAGPNELSLYLKDSKGTRVYFFTRI